MFSPILFGTMVFFALPFVLVVFYSFGIGRQFSFVGLENYKKVLNSEAFQLAARNTVKFLILGVPMLLVLALGIALLLKQKFPMQIRRNNRIKSPKKSTFMQMQLTPKIAPQFVTTLVLPLVLPIASIVMFVEWIVPQSVLESENAFWVLLALYLWKNCGYITILLLAGLSMIPQGLYDTAAIEGANGWQKLWYVTLPLLKPSLVFSAVIGIIQNFKSYREAFLLSGRHPNESIYLLQHFLNNNFENLNYTRLAVASVLTALPIVLIMIVVLLLKKRGIVRKCLCKENREHILSCKCLFCKR